MNDSKHPLPVEAAEPSPAQCKHLEAVLAEKGLSLKGTYTYADAVEILGGSKRALQDRIRDGKLRSRDLPGRAHFLSVDLEEFLRGSVKTPNSGSEKK
jgi:hypothetical protein